MGWQEEELAKRNKLEAQQREAYEECSVAVRRAWDMILSENEKLMPELRLQTNSTKHYRSILKSAKHPWEICLYFPLFVFDPNRLELKEEDFPCIKTMNLRFKIYFDSSRRKLIAVYFYQKYDHNGNPTLNGIKYRFDYSSIVTIIKNLCLGSRIDKGLLPDCR